MASDNWGVFKFNDTVTDYLAEDQQGWIDILSWDWAAKHLPMDT